MRTSTPKKGHDIQFLTCSLWGLLLALVTAGPICTADMSSISTSVTLGQKSVNGVRIERHGHRLVVYGDPEQRWETADMVLFTHGRRDVAWAGRTLVENGAQAVVPAREKEHFTDVGAFWSGFWDKRFHDYAQQSTRLLATPLRVDRAVQDGDTLQWQDLAIRVVGTPGYTRGAESYFVDVDNVRYGFVGDVIYGEGHLLDLYSLQDTVADARIGGYHGYAGRIGDLIQSLRTIAARNPGVLVPARGPVIREPRIAIERLIERLQAVYRNYLSINAGHWYFRERYDVLATRALGLSPDVDWMPYAGTIRQKPPAWIVPIHNSRLILAADGSGFLVDCGSRAIINELRKLRDEGRLGEIEGLFITHYHDDHTDKVNELLAEFDCPVYVTPILEDVLRRPGAYRLPAMTANPIEKLTVVPDGARRHWKEFALTFFDYPGQTIYHDALLVEKDDGQRIFFVGDSFTPSGIDDYCLLNRNVLREGTGYLYCLEMLRDTISSDALLINEHVIEPFRYDPEQVDHMLATLAKRRELLNDLFPWDEPNYGTDEQWARLVPYGQQAKPGDTVEMGATLLNHSGAARTFEVALITPAGYSVVPPRATATIAPGREGRIRFKVTVPSTVAPGVSVLTADVRFGVWDLPQWSEALLKIAP